MRKFYTILFFTLFVQLLKAADVWVEAESFASKGGWVVDQQFMDIMGSPYLMAYGMGTPVEDASTVVSFPEKGVYHIYVRTFNWTSPWYNGKGPGKFTLKVDDRKLATTLGDEGNNWMWQKAGKVTINKASARVSLHDLTGFNGRCDAIFFTTEEDKLPPTDRPEQPTTRKQYDFVVVGGGVAGICAAVSAARNGCKVALINDRPVLGGNNSSEIRVHLGGRIEVGPYPNLGNLLKEFGHSTGGNAQPAENYEDDKKMNLVLAEKNITLYSNFRAIAVEMNETLIQSVMAKHIETGERVEFTAPLFSDCTGDGTIGHLAGADYLMGREGRDQFNESIAPVQADSMTMGASVQWYSIDKGKPVRFPKFEYGIQFTDESCEKVLMGEWRWENGMNRNQITEAERIRDYGLLVVYSNWSYQKNNLKDNSEYKNRVLGWVAYIAGKRESRRLLGDYILKEEDLLKNVFHEDGTAATTWTIDLHFPDPANGKHFPGNEFKAETTHTPIYPYPIPYRCLYSRNVDNLFFAGRNISVTHVALGTTRVMRTTAMLGEVVGLAASICKKYNATPRQVYFYHLNKLKALMKEGAGKKGLPNNQEFNIGGTII